MKNVDAILVSDLHIRETTPECRTDDFIETQTRKYKWLSELEKKYKCPILNAGDLFNYWKPSPWLLAWALRTLPSGIITIPGQHDLPAHNLDNIEKSGIQVLSDAGKVVIVNSTRPRHWNDINFSIMGFPWNIELTKARDVCEVPQVAIIHYGVYQNKPHYPGAENIGGTAKSVIKRMPGFNLIISGDNHLTFTERVGNSLLVNPGSFTRQTAAQIDHKPSVFLWYAETNEVEQMFVPIEKNVINRTHIDKVEARDERLEAFISKLDTKVDISISFKENLKIHLAKNKISKEIETIIWGCINETR
jgi:hypothetical protein